MAVLAIVTMIGFAAFQSNIQHGEPIEGVKPVTDFLDQSLILKQENMTFDLSTYGRLSFALSQRGLSIQDYSILDLDSYRYLIGEESNYPVNFNYVVFLGDNFDNPLFGYSWRNLRPIDAAIWNLIANNTEVNLVYSDGTNAVFGIPNRMWNV
jgi:hypothetical protein